MARPPKTPTPEQLAAVQRFATQHGHGWKQRLVQVWAQDAICPDAALLRQVRNQFGPAWLHGRGCQIRPTRVGEVAFACEVLYATRTTKSIWYAVITAPGASTKADMERLARAALVVARPRAREVIATLVHPLTH